MAISTVLQEFPSYIFIMCWHQPMAELALSNGPLKAASADSLDLS